MGKERDVIFGNGTAPHPPNLFFFPNSIVQIIDFTLLNYIARSKHIVKITDFTTMTYIARSKHSTDHQFHHTDLYSNIQTYSTDH